MSKGSKQRPRLVSREYYFESWVATYGDICLECSGIGMIDTQVCNTCKGIGKVEQNYGNE